MYGLEKKPGEKFEFDLTKQIKADPAQGKKILEKAEKQVHELKKLLREGANEKDFDRYGILLHGYSALQKVVKKIPK